MVRFSAEFTPRSFTEFTLSRTNGFRMTLRGIYPFSFFRASSQQSEWTQSDKAKESKRTTWHSPGPDTVSQWKGNLRLDGSVEMTQ